MGGKIIADKTAASHLSFEVSRRLLCGYISLDWIVNEGMLKANVDLNTH
jgi:hypothetical protein